MTEYAGARARLAAERTAALARLTSLEQEFRGIIESAGTGGTDDEHDPEGATIAFERQHVAALASQTRERLAEIDQALRRLSEGCYGICERCGRPIGAARPAAARCLACASRP